MKKSANGRPTRQQQQKDKWRTCKVCSWTKNTGPGLCCGVPL